MSSRTGESSADDGADLIEEAGARNASVEIQYESRQGELLVARSRILGADAEHLYLDSPQSIGGEVRIRSGLRFDGYMQLNEIRYTFKSTVEEVGELVRINADKRVVGLVVRRPVVVREGQRRTHFRVSLLGADPITPELHVALPDGTGTSPIEAHRFFAQLVNLSVGGAGLQVEEDDARPLAVGGLLFMTFRLPDEAEAFTFLVEIRQFWDLPRDTARRMGVKIRAWPSRRAMQRVQQRLQRYVTAVQRARLRPTG